MHNNRIKGKWLAVLAVLLPWMAWAQVPPPVVRNVLDTNLVSFGTAGQALFRTTVLPLLNWSNAPNQAAVNSISNSIYVILSNMIVSVTGLKSNFIVSAHGTIDVTNNATVGGWVSQVGGTNWGDAAHTNWVTASTATGNDFLVTNTAGGSVRVVNGRLVIPANGATTGGASNLVGGLTLGHTNDQRAYLTIGLTNGSGITNEWAILVTTNGTASTASQSTYPLLGVRTNGDVWIRGTLSIPTASGTTLNFQNVRNASGSVLYGAGLGFISDASGASVTVGAGNGTYNPSNNLFIAGTCISSNGMVIKIHNGTAYTNNASPVLTVIPPIAGPYDGATWGGYVTNILEVQDTNGTPAFVINSNAAVGINTNAPSAQLSIFGQTNNGAVIFQVGSRNIATGSAGGTNSLIVLTNGRVGIGCKPTATLDIQTDTPTFVVKATAANNANFQLWGGQPGDVSWTLMSGFPNAGDFTWREAGVANYLTLKKTTGNFGIGTSTPPAILTVTANNAQQYVAQFGTTNKPQLAVLDTNGAMVLNSVAPVGCFGALMNNTSNTVVCAGGAGVYTNICGTGFTTITTNGFIGGTQAISAGLTNLIAGYYRVFINASYLGGNATTYEFDVTTNGVICSLLEVKNTTDNPARFRTSSTGGIIYLPANCGVQMMVQDGGGGSTINVFRSALTIGTP